MHEMREHALSHACDHYPLYRDGAPLRIEGPNGELISAAEIQNTAKRTPGSDEHGSKAEKAPLKARQRRSARGIQR
jgi:hypothetical protein